MSHRTALGLLRVDGSGRFRLTDRGQLLRRDRLGSLRSIAIAVGGPWYRTFGDLAESVRMGQPRFENRYGHPFFEYTRSHPEFGGLFDAAMREVSAMEASVIAIAYDFSRHRHIVDVGGGLGGQLCAILRQHPGLTGTLFDRPDTIERAREVLEPEVAPRITLAGGDFFSAVPDGGDVYVLKTIVHDWDDDAATRILASCRAAIPMGGRLLLVDHVIEPGNRFQFGRMLDPLMLSALGGQERTREQFELLLGRAGFWLERVRPTLSPLSIVQAVPI